MEDADKNLGSQLLAVGCWVGKNLYETCYFKASPRIGFAKKKGDQLAALTMNFTDCLQTGIMVITIRQYQ